MTPKPWKVSIEKAVMTHDVMVSGASLTKRAVPSDLFNISQLENESKWEKKWNVFSNIQAKQSQYLHQIRFMRDKPSIITNFVQQKFQVNTIRFF